jgi:hypothetical protein
LAVIRLVVNCLHFRKHALMEDTRNQNAAGFFAVKDNVPAKLHPAKAGTNIVTRTAQHRIIP